MLHLIISRDNEDVTGENSRKMIHFKWIDTQVKEGKTFIVMFRSARYLTIWLTLSEIMYYGIYSFS